MLDITMSLKQHTIEEFVVFSLMMLFYFVALKYIVINFNYHFISSQIKISLFIYFFADIKMRLPKSGD